MIRSITLIALLTAALAVPATIRASQADTSWAECEGIHCTISGMWGASTRLYANINLWTELEPPAHVPLCTNNARISFPINAGGLTDATVTSEIVRPIHFKENLSFLGITSGLVTEQRPDGTWRPAYRSHDNRLDGIWSDRYTVTNALTGEPVNGLKLLLRDNDQADFLAYETVTGPVTVTLERKVDLILWAHPTLQRQIDNRDIYDTTVMTSSVTIDCGDPALPNLTVAAHLPVHLAAGEELNIAASVTNTGTAPAAGTTARLRLDYGADGFYDQNLPETAVPGLASAATAPAAWPNRALPAGTHRLEICVDPAGTVAEVDETDNCITRFIEVEAPIVPTPTPTPPPAGGPTPQPTAPTGTVREIE